MRLSKLNLTNFQQYECFEDEHVYKAVTITKPEFMKHFFTFKKCSYILCDHTVF